MSEHCKKGSFEFSFPWPGPQRAGSFSVKKNFFGASSKGGPAKNLNTKSERLSVAELLGPGLKG